MNTTNTALDMNNTDTVIDEIRAENTVRFLASNEFIIPTKCIVDLERKLMMWSAIGATGACVWGRPRLGKSFSIQYIAKKFKEKYGEDFPVIIWNVTDHPDTERSFYASILLAMGLKVPKSFSSIFLKERLINEIKLMATGTRLRRVVFFIDEAWKLHLTDFSWLMDLYNNVALENIHFTCFLFGTRELKDLKRELQCNGKEQIVQRFMIKEEEFFGLTSEQEIARCLYELDNTKASDEYGIKSNENLIDFFFPHADGKAFIDLAKDYWNAFEQVRSRYGIVPKDIPMKYFIDSFNILLLTYGKTSVAPIAFPTIRELTTAIEVSCYGETGEKNEYKNTKNKR